MNCFSCATLDDEEKVPNHIEVMPRGSAPASLPNDHDRGIPAAHLPNASAPRLTPAEKKRFLEEQEEKLERDWPAASMAIHARPFHQFSRNSVDDLKNMSFNEAVQEYILKGVIRKHLEKIPARQRDHP